MKNDATPDALTQVWAWKDAIYREVAELPVEEALQEIMRKAAAAARAYGLDIDAT